MSFGDFLLIGLALVSIVVVPRAIWRAWTQPAVPEDAAPRRPAPPPMELPPVVRGLVEVVKRPFMVYDDDYDEPVVMSRQPTRETIENPQNRGLAKPEESGLQGVATERNDANDPLAGQALGAARANDLGDITPAEARAIIRQQARAEAIVAILKAAEAGKVKSAGDQAGLIEAVSGAARTSRPGSPYTHLKAVVDDLRGKPKPQYRELDSDKRPAELSQAGAE